MSWYFDLHPRTDPFAGALVQRMEGTQENDLQRAEYRGEANGAGVGIIGLRGDGAYGQQIDPAGLQYIKVRRSDTLAVDGGFFLEKGDFAALTEKRSRYLELSGAGPLSYLDREVMWRYTYETWGNDPEEGGVDVWQLHSQSTVYAGGDYLGAVLWRVLHEALGYVNAPGYLARTPLEDDKLETAIPGVTLTFDGFEDSSGNAWTLPSGEFTARVGESVYAVVQRLMRAGLYVEMDPDTGAISAWEAAGHRRSRTGAAYGADVVRFEGGDNIKSETKRAIAAYMRRTAVLAYGQNMGSMATGAGDVPWHGSVYSDAQDEDALEQLAASEIAHRADVGDVLRLRIKMGDDPLNGAYMPFQHILLDDVVTVHTGATQWDHDEASYPVAALEIKLRPAGDWDAFAHLGAVFMDAASRAFQAVGDAPVSPHSHPQPCRPGTAAGTTVLRLYPSAGVPGVDAYAGIPNPTFGGWDAFGTGASGRLMLTDDQGSAAGNIYATSVAEGLAAGRNNHGVQFIWPLEGSGTLSGYIRGQALAKMPSGIGVPDSLQDMMSQMLVRVLASDGTTVKGTALAFHNPASTAGAKWSLTDRNAKFPASPSWSGDLGAPLTPVSYVDGDLLVIEVGSRNFTPTGEVSGHFIRRTGTAGSDLPIDETTTTQLNSWFDLVLEGTSADIGDGHPDLVGTGVRWSRCGHKHHVLRTTDPTVNDDWETAGYPTTTLWTNTTTGDSFLLVDASTGAADWQPFGGGGSSGPHAASHEDGGADEVEIANLPTSETDTALVLHPDGSGGVAWGADATGGGGGGGTDPFGVGVPFTAALLTRIVSLGFSTGNRGVYQRVIGSGTITKIGLQVGASAGNISVAVYRKSGVGHNAVPGVRLATTGTIACPAVGYAEVALGTSVDVEPGDFFFVSVSSNSTQLWGTYTGAIAGSFIALGFSMYQDSAMPAPGDNPTVTNGNNGFIIAMVGVP